VVLSWLFHLTGVLQQDVPHPSLMKPNLRPMISTSLCHCTGHTDLRHAALLTPANTASAVLCPRANNAKLQEEKPTNGAHHPRPRFPPAQSCGSSLCGTSPPGRGATQNPGARRHTDLPPQKGSFPVVIPLPPRCPVESWPGRPDAPESRADPRAPSMMATTPGASTGRREGPHKSRRAVRRDRRGRRRVERAGPYLHRSSRTLLGISARLVSMGKRGSSRHGETPTHGSAARAELSAARPAGGAAKAERQLAPPIPCCVPRRALLARRRGVPISVKAARERETQVIAETNQKGTLPPSCAISACARGVMSAAAAILVAGATCVSPAGSGGGTAALGARHAQ